MERLDEHAPSGVRLRMLPPEIRRDGGQFPLRLLDGRTGSEPGDRKEVLDVALLQQVTLDVGSGRQPRRLE